MKRFYKLGGKNINFEEDLIDFIKKDFEVMGIKISSDEENKELLIKHLNMVNKVIESKKYKVYISKKINEKKYNDELIKIIDSIKWKFENGININPYLSTRIFKLNYHDSLFNDWGIHHLHLSTKKYTKNPFFYERSDYLLFVFIEDTDVYFLDIQKHKEENVFQRQELLEIMYDNWPKILEKNCLNLDTEYCNKFTNKEIERFRKNGINVLQNIGGKAIVPLGGGYTTSKSNIMCTYEADTIIYRLKRYEKIINDNREMISEQIIEKTGEKIIELDFKLYLEKNGEMKIREINTGVYINL